MICYVVMEMMFVVVVMNYVSILHMQAIAFMLPGIMYTKDLEELRLSSQMRSIWSLCYQKKVEGRI